MNRGRRPRKPRPRVQLRAMGARNSPKAPSRAPRARRGDGAEQREGGGGGKRRGSQGGQLRRAGPFRGFEGPRRSQAAVGGRSRSPSGSLGPGRPPSGFAERPGAAGPSSSPIQAASGSGAGPRPAGGRGRGVRPTWGCAGAAAANFRGSAPTLATAGRACSVLRGARKRKQAGVSFRPLRAASRKRSPQGRRGAWEAEAGWGPE